jgi:zinc D-Ala-D-Ala carboxypeptidase
MDQKLSEHFNLSEFLTSTTASQRGIVNVPNDAELANLFRLADVLEKVRKVLNTPIIITSGFRCSELNTAVGGVKNSAHLTGCAADFVSPRFGSPKTVCKAIEPHIKEFEIDQLILEFNSWTHLGIAAAVPRHMAFTINNNGTTNGFV